MDKGIKISITNICGPEKPLKFGNDALSKEILFMSFLKTEFLQLSVFSHCGNLKMGIHASKMNVQPRKIMDLVEEAL